MATPHSHYDLHQGPTTRRPVRLTAPEPTRHGAQGDYNTPSDGSLENEFDTKVVEDAIKVILAKGQLQENEVSMRTSHTSC